MGKNTKIQWHSAFYSAMRLELLENKEELEFTKELILNTMPIRVDLLILKKDPSCIIQNEIGRFFRTHNLVESYIYSRSRTQKVIEKIRKREVSG